jgi:ADP-ribosylglycohydrolase/protein-tyrosine phosphatase
MKPGAHVRTSDTHPIDVAWLPVGGPGRVGMTFAPGKHAPSRSGDPWRRDLRRDLDRLVAHHGARVLVCLLEDHELPLLRIEGYLDEARERGLEVIRLPMEDGGVPDAMRPLVDLVATIRARAAAGANVVIHCAAGLGRTGVVAGSVLVAEGTSAEEAIATLQRVRDPKSPENDRQKDYLALVEREYRTAATSSVPERRARIVGAVLGAAIGDAMGHPTEFKRLPEIRRLWGPSGVTGFELLWDRDGQVFAPYTDDTQMAEAVLRTLVDARGHDLDATMRAMAKAFVAWKDDPQGGHRAPGNACLTGCEALARGVRWSEAGGEHAGGCGSVMRAYPFGLVFADDLDRAEAWAVAHSKLTHRDPIALAACAAMAIGTALALERAAPEIVLAAMIAAARRHDETTGSMMQRALDEARAGVDPDETLTRLQSWAAHEAISAAVFVFARHPDDPRAAILEGANTDGDSDSIATLAGALVGARCGIEAIPAEWVEKVERTRELQALAARVQ